MGVIQIRDKCEFPLRQQQSSLSLSYYIYHTYSTTIGLLVGWQLISLNCPRISALSRCRSISQWPPSLQPLTSGRWHIPRYGYCFADIFPSTHTLVRLGIVVSDYFDKSRWAEIGESGHRSHQSKSNDCTTLYRADTLKLLYKEINCSLVFHGIF